MKQIKVSEATGPALDWLVARCLSYTTAGGTKDVPMSAQTGCGIVAPWNPSTDWAIGGPIIEREGISSRRVNAMDDDEVDTDMHHWWCAAYSRKSLQGYDGLKDDIDLHWGTTPLIAAMRCFCISKLGDTAEVPEELL